jgi:putative ABC transport system ATP-binding protein
MILEASDLRRTFQRGEKSVEILKGISFSVKQGEFISIMGPSGSGKSTLLQIIGGLDRVTKGTVRFEGTALESFSDQELSIFRRRKLGYVFQFFNLLPTLTALENVALPRLLDGARMSDVTPKALEILDFMGMKRHADQKPYQLSGGEMQRVALARALVTDPILILADEPTGSLDSKTGASVLGLLKSACEERGHTLVMVTHDAQAATYGNRIIRLSDGQIESDQKMGH